MVGAAGNGGAATGAGGAADALGVLLGDAALEGGAAVSRSSQMLSGSESSSTCPLLLFNGFSEACDGSITQKSP